MPVSLDAGDPIAFLAGSLDLLKQLSILFGESDEEERYASGLAPAVAAVAWDSHGAAASPAPRPDGHAIRAAVLRREGIVALDPIEAVVAVLRDMP